jgi:hypothetical protein
MINITQNTNSMISVRYTYDGKQSDQSVDALVQFAEQLQQFPGFSHYRLIEADDAHSSPILLTFWLSSAYYRKAIKQLNQDAQQHIA